MTQPHRRPRHDPRPSSTRRAGRSVARPRPSVLYARSSSRFGRDGGSRSRRSRSARDRCPGLAPPVAHVGVSVLVRRWACSGSAAMSGVVSRQEPRLGDGWHAHVAVDVEQPACRGRASRRDGVREVVLVDLPVFRRPARLSWHEQRWPCPSCGPANNGGRHRPSTCAAGSSSTSPNEVPSRSGRSPASVGVSGDGATATPQPR